MTTPATTFPTQYTVRRKVLTLAGAQFHVRTPSEKLIAFTQLKAFKLKEDIRVYADEAKSHELLAIQARQVIDISASYDVTDTSTGGARVGTLQRKGMKSILRDEWVVLDATGREFALIQEESMVVALLRRFINLIPQSFHVKVGEKVVGRIHQNFNPFVLKLTVDFGEDRGKKIDPRLGLAAAILLAAIEGRQG
jgi:hypothetical protein